MRNPFAGQLVMMPFSLDTLSSFGPRNLGQSSPVLRVRKSVGSAAKQYNGIVARKEIRKRRMARILHELDSARTDDSSDYSTASNSSQEFTFTCLSTTSV
jgi:hypothetical protein